MLKRKTSRETAKRPFITLLVLSTVVLAFTLVIYSNTRTNSATASPQQSDAHHGIVALDGYRVSHFASSTSSYTNPDSLVVDSGQVYIDYQNKTAKDCADHNSSTVVEYTMDGEVVKTFSIPGHSDGMRVDPATHLLWTTSCEDGNPKFATIDPKNGTITSYTFPAPPHGGGYDDLYFLNGMAFIAASNPTLDATGKNTNPAVDQVTLSKGQVVLKPILMGNATATDNTTSPPSQVTLNLTDPDSLSTDGKGDLVLVSQADAELVLISHPGPAQQSVSRIPVGTQLDDTAWATSSEGRLLVADGATGLTFWIRPTHLVTGTIYTEAPSDSGVAGFVGVVDPSTGIIHPVAIGFVNPTGMLFVPDSDG
jgi:hypothetical protein